MILEDIFKYKTPVYGKLVEYGFVQQGDKYIYRQAIVSNQFDLRVSIFADGKIQTQVVDLNTEEEYRLHLIEGVVGEFVGKVRSECLKILQTMAESCFEDRIFKSKYVNEIICYIKEKYQDNFEYLWEKFPDNAIVRRSDNKKWYAAILTVEKNKIGLEGKEKTEVIDLRKIPEEIKELVDGKRYFAGYHMNKKHWLTICLDGSVDLSEIYRHIDESYILAKKK